MKKLTTLLVLVIIFTSASIPDENSPSKSDTFDYILHEIGDALKHYGWSGNLYKMTVKSYNKEKNTISLSHLNNQTHCEYIETINLNDLKSTFFNESTEYGRDLNNNDTPHKYIPGLSIYFKTESLKRKAICQGLGSGPSTSSKIFIAMWDKNRLEKLSRAFDHMISLNGGFKPGLFDK